MCSHKQLGGSEGVGWEGGGGVVHHHILLFALSLQFLEQAPVITLKTSTITSPEASASVQC